MIPATRVLLSVFLLSTIALAQSRVERNIVYGMYSGTALLMDVHYPVNANGVGVIFVPGSGWSADTAYGAAGIKDGEIPRIWVPPLTGAGYTVFVPNHRGTPAFHYPDPVHDIQRAVRFVRHNAPRFKIDANRLGGLGGSSGGHLIALMGLMDGKAEDDSGDPVDQQSAKLQALVLYSAPVDLSMVPVGASVGAFLRVPPPTPRTPKATARLYQEASPISYVTADDPPDASPGRRRRYQCSAPPRHGTSRGFAEGARSVQADNHSPRNARADLRIGSRRASARPIGPITTARWCDGSTST